MSGFLNGSLDVFFKVLASVDQVLLPFISLMFQFFIDTFDVLAVFGSFKVLLFYNSFKVLLPSNFIRFKPFKIMSCRSLQLPLIASRFQLSSFLSVLYIPSIPSCLQHLLIPSRFYLSLITSRIQRTSVPLIPSVYSFTSIPSRFYWHPSILLRLQL